MKFVRGFGWFGSLLCVWLDDMAIEWESHGCKDGLCLLYLFSSI